MKSDVMPALVQLNEKHLSELCTEVKETIATEVVASQKKKNSFAASDLWNTRRTMHTAAGLWSNKTRIQSLT